MRMLLGATAMYYTLSSPCIHIHVYVHKYIHTYLHTVHTYVCTHVHGYIHIVHTYICTNIHTYTHTVHTYVHTYIHTHISTHARAVLENSSNVYLCTYQPATKLPAAQYDPSQLWVQW